MTYEFSAHHAFYFFGNTEEVVLTSVRTVAFGGLLLSSSFQIQRGCDKTLTGT